MTTPAQEAYNAANPPVAFRIDRATVDAVDEVRDLYPSADNGTPSRSAVLRAMFYVAAPLVTDRALMAKIDAARGSASRGAFVANLVRRALEGK